MVSLTSGCARGDGGDRSFMQMVIEVRVHPREHLRRSPGKSKIINSTYLAGKVGRGLVADVLCYNETGSEIQWEPRESVVKVELHVHLVRINFLA